MDVVRMRIEQKGKEQKVRRGESIPGRRSLRYP